MDTDRILAILRNHAAELQAAGLTHLRLFGSVARGEATPHSDIDLLADYDPEKTVTLLTLGGLDQRRTCSQAAGPTLEEAWVAVHFFGIGGLIDDVCRVLGGNVFGCAT